MENPHQPHAPARKGKPFAAKKPKRISPSYLENSALFYLQRFDSTAANLRRVLLRKVKKASMLATPEAPAVNDGQARQWIDDVIAKMQRLGYIDDARTASTKAHHYLGQGTPPSVIRQKLFLAGAQSEIIDTTMDSLAENHGENLSFYAAIRYAKRRRFGPFRSEDKREDRRDKDLAALARKGFDLDTARRVIDANDAEYLLEILYTHSDL